MKILHTLVGYLAVTALPFHSFASPLAAIDYDGYVDTTKLKHTDSALMKHIFGNVLETCQTVTSHGLSGYYVNTTQNHSDSATLLERVPGDIIIEGRIEVPPEVPPAVLLVIAIVLVVAISIIWTEGDDPVRNNEVEFLVEHSYQKSSGRDVYYLPKILSPG